VSAIFKYVNKGLVLHSIHFIINYDLNNANFFRKTEKIRQFNRPNRYRVLRMRPQRSLWKFNRATVFETIINTRCLISLSLVFIIIISIIYNFCNNIELPFRERATSGDILKLFDLVVVDDVDGILFLRYPENPYYKHQCFIRNLYSVYLKLLF